MTYPAYEDTTVVARSLDAVRQEIERRSAADDENAEDDDSDANDSLAEISPERQRDIDFCYREMGRLIRHVEDKNRSAEDRPASE